MSAGFVYAEKKWKDPLKKKKWEDEVMYCISFNNRHDV